MLEFDKVFGVIGTIKAEEKLPEEIKELLRRREEARKIKDWKTADEIRAELKRMGVVVEDTAQGAKWRIKKG